MCSCTHHKLKTDKEKNTPNWSHTGRVVCQLSGLDPGVSGGEEGRERNDREMRDILLKKEMSKRLKRKMQDTVTQDEGLQQGGRV